MRPSIEALANRFSSNWTAQVALAVATASNCCFTRTENFLHLHNQTNCKLSLSSESFKFEVKHSWKLISRILFPTRSTRQANPALQIKHFFSPDIVVIGRLKCPKSESEILFVQVSELGFRFLPAPAALAVMNYFFILRHTTRAGGAQLNFFVFQV